MPYFVDFSKLVFTYVYEGYYLRREHNKMSKSAGKLETLEYRNPGSPILPRHPFRGLVTGSSGSGKSHWVITHWILNPETPFDRVLWCAPKTSLKQEKLVKLAEAMPDAITLIEGIDKDVLAKAIRP